MSSAMDAKPNGSKKASYSRKQDDDGAEWREVDIYERTDRDEQTDFYGSPVHRTTLRRAALGLGALCVLMTAGTVALSTHFALENEQLQISIQNLSNNYVLLQERLSDVSGRYVQLQIGYETLNKSCHQVHDVLNSEEAEAGLKSCSGGWTRFGSSCYFRSTERKTWFGSRYDCETRGSDLVMINSREEQEFVSKLSVNEDSWFGLRTEVMSQAYVWKWVDGSAPTEMFWAPGLTHEPSNWYFAACCDPHGKWTQSLNFDNKEKTWICEMQIPTSP